MNFGIEQGSNGIAEMSWEKPTGIQNNIYLSINLKKGTLFNLPSFGLDLSDIKKLTNDKINLIQGRVEKALQWIIDLEKARSIDVIVEKNSQSIGRVDIFIRAVEADGTPVNIKTFRTVGGPNDGFTI